MTENLKLKNIFENLNFSVQKSFGAFLAGQKRMFEDKFTAHLSSNSERLHSMYSIVDEKIPGQADPLKIAIMPMSKKR